MSEQSMYLVVEDGLVELRRPDGRDAEDDAFRVDLDHANDDPEHCRYLIEALEAQPRSVMREQLLDSLRRIDASFRALTT